MMQIRKKVVTLQHHGRKIKAMTEQEIEDFIRKVEEGLQEAQYNMLKGKALHDDYVVISNRPGNIMNVPAKELLEASR